MTVCPFCLKEFNVLGRHTWRCPVKLASAAGPGDFPKLNQQSTSAVGFPTLDIPGAHSYDSNTVNTAVAHTASTNTTSSCFVTTSDASAKETLPPADHLCKADTAYSALTSVEAPPPRVAVPVPIAVQGLCTEYTSGAGSANSPSHSPIVCSIDSSCALAAKPDGPTRLRPVVSNSSSIAVVYLACHCGRQCVGFRGLRAHQRSCRATVALAGLSPGADKVAYVVPPIASTLNETENETALKLIVNNSSSVSEINLNLSSYVPDLIPVPSIRLPRGVEGWNEAHAYFLAYPPLPTSLSDLDECAALFQKNIYNYFKSACGLHAVGHGANPLGGGPSVNSSNRGLRNRLRDLKARKAPIPEIQGVSHALRRGLKKHAVRLNPLSHFLQYRRNPWVYMNDFSRSVSPAPSFNNSVCELYFNNILSEKSPLRPFAKPEWMPMLDQPLIPFDPDLSPSFTDISRIVSSMKAGTSPCPLDSISIIAFKNCPILRTHLARLLAACWARKHFPKVWRRAIVTLIHKKGSTSDPQNFRPIALQPVLGKILNAFVRNKLWHFLTANRLLDVTMQKGFWPGIDGVTEHVELLSYLLRHQKHLKRDIYVVLLDLKNAFGEVHHSLIKFALEHHHVPQDVISLIMSQYTDFYLCVTASGSTLRTLPIHVQRGVLQGDAVPPALQPGIRLPYVLPFQSPNSVLWRPVGRWPYQIPVDPVCR